MRGHANANRFKPVIPAYAVILMHHQITGGKLAGFGNQFIRPAATTRWPPYALTQQVLLGHKRQIIAHKATFQLKRHKPHRAGLGLAGLLPALVGFRGQSVFTQQNGNALA